MAGISIKEVAKIAGVSIATVSRCLNSPEQVTAKTRTKVEDAVAKTGYRPNTLARSFRRGHSNMVIVVLPSVGDPFFGAVMQGIRGVAESHGYSILIEETDRNTITADDIGAKVASKQADGIILLASLSPFGTEVVSSESRRALPIVVGCEAVAPELFAFPSVHVDNVKAAFDATKHLIQQGHSRIAMITGTSDSLLTRDREFGYRKAMQDAGLEVEDGWIAEGLMTITGARQATHELLSLEHKPTAIFCANDQMAMGCMHEIKRAGLSIPGDVSVVGFDDIPFAEVLDPPLTTIGQPAEEIGLRVMQRLHREIKGTASQSTEPEILPHRLVDRQSVAPPPS